MSTHTESGRKVAVLGAGFSGLRAASELEALPLPSSKRARTSVVGRAAIGVLGIGWIPPGRSSADTTFPSHVGYAISGSAIHSCLFAQCRRRCFSVASSHPSTDSAFLRPHEFRARPSGNVSSCFVGVV